MDRPPRPPARHSRPPTAEERARSTGRSAHLEALDLTPRQLFDVVGNHFDPDSLNIRWGICIRNWLVQPTDLGMIPRPPSHQLAIFKQVRRAVAALEVPVDVSQPFPKDIRPLLMAAEDAARRAHQAGQGQAGTVAAEDGCGDL